MRGGGNQIDGLHGMIIWNRLCRMWSSRQFSRTLWSKDKDRDLWSEEGKHKDKDLWSEGKYKERDLRIGPRGQGPSPRTTTPLVGWTMSVNQSIKSPTYAVLVVGMATEARPALTSVATDSIDASRVDRTVAVQALVDVCSQPPSTQVTKNIYYL